MSVTPAHGPARAAGVVALALAAAALAPDPTPARCDDPHELAGREGRTLEVGCAGAGVALRGPARLLFGQAIDPNRADAATLEVLPGIGAERAAALVAVRTRRPFCHPDDLESVKGIGPTTRRKLETWLDFGASDACRKSQKGR